jgi:hypothetical protein
MALLDDLYGEGTLAAFEEALGGNVRTREFDRDRGVQVEATWEDGSRMIVLCREDSVDFQSLVAASKGDGLYTHLCKTLPDLFADRGVERFTAVGTDEASTDVLLSRGGWEQHEGHDGYHSRLVWQLRPGGEE